MRVKRILSQVLAGIILLLFTVVIAACGSSSAAAGTTSTVTATATSCISQATGTIKGINGTTLLVTNMQGKDVQAVLTSKTTFARQATLKPADLKVGMLVSVTVTQNPDTTYSALAVNVRASLTRTGGFTRGSALCNGQRPRGAFGGPGFGSGAPGSGQSRQTISGTVNQINAGSLTVTDTSGNDFTVSLTTTTRISSQQTFSASDLRVGEAVTITGSANSQGVINASSVSILQALPTRRTTPTPTPGT